MSDLIQLASELTRQLRDSQPQFAADLDAAVRRVASREWSVLVSGLCSVGKSSFVSALWGDSDLLPTAVRDCTQTNTLIRPPLSNEQDRRIVLKYLARDAAIQFALKGLACHRITEMLQDFHGVSLPRLDEMLPEARLRFAAGEARRIYAARRDLQVLNEPLTDEMEQLENLIEFMDSPEYPAGVSVAARWEDRREHLMGRRREDGRLTGTGRLMALEHVEILRETNWAPAGELKPPVLIDTPWVPTLHNARREDLILDQARRADVLLVLALPQRYDAESWLLTLFRKRPEMAKTTVVVFNQVDTCDPRTLFSRDGFSGIYEDNRDRLARLGINPANILISCARLKFLQNSLAHELSEPSSKSANPFGTSALPERIARLEKVLSQMREQARSRPDGELKSKLLAACDPADAGVETVRRKVEELAKTTVAQRQRATLLNLIANFDGRDLSTTAKVAWERFQSAVKVLEGRP